MLKKIGLKNFKAFGNEMQIAPLSRITLIYGQNSGGKSSIVQALMLLKQSLDSPRVGYRRELMVRGDTSRGDVDLGGFTTLIHQHVTAQPLELTVGYEVGNAQFIAESNLTFVAEEQGDVNSPAILKSFTHQLFREERHLFEVEVDYDPQYDYWTNSRDFKIVEIDNDSDNKDGKFFPTWRMLSLDNDEAFGRMEGSIRDELHSTIRDLAEFDRIQRLQQRRQRMDLIQDSIPVAHALQRRRNALEDSEAA